MKVTAIVGSYRKGGTGDSAVEEILAAAKEAGAETAKMYLSDTIWSTAPTAAPVPRMRGRVLAAVSWRTTWRGSWPNSRADGLVLASPVNVGTVTAVMKTFLESWSAVPTGPGERRGRRCGTLGNKRALLVISSAAPALMTRWFTGTAGILEKGAAFLGARTIGTLYIGLAAGQPHQSLAGRDAAAGAASWSEAGQGLKIVIAESHQVSPEEDHERTADSRRNHRGPRRR